MSGMSEFESIIATRNLEFIEAEGKKEIFLIRIMLPIKSDEGNDYCCTHVIASESINKSFRIVGVDAVQALDLSLKSIGPYLEYVEKIRNGKFYFLNEVGHCFPR